MKGLAGARIKYFIYLYTSTVGQVELAETGPSMQIATVNASNCVTGRFMVKFQDLDEQRTKRK